MKIEKKEKLASILDNLRRHFPDQEISEEDATYLSPYLYVNLKEYLVPVPGYWKYSRPPASNYSKHLKVPESFLQLFNSEGTETNHISEISESIRYENNFYFVKLKSICKNYDGTSKFFTSHFRPGVISRDLYTALNKNMEIFDSEGFSEPDEQNVDKILEIDSSFESV